MKYTNYSIKDSVSHINSDLSTYEIQPNIDYLLSILNIRRYSKSKAQDDFVNDLEKFYTDNGAIAERDVYGNLYVTKGESSLYPCIVAHTDINQTKRSNVSVMISGDTIFGFDNDEALQCGIGADDGAGIALAYEMFNRFDAIKLFFPLNEEVGCLGSKEADLTFFTDCSMILQGDRRSYTTDLITYTNGIDTCSKEFVNAASEIMDSYGYSENRGVYTDVGQLKKDSIVDCIACNVSIGYFNEHSDEEVMSVKAYYNAVNFVYSIIKELGNQKWHHIYTPKQLDIFDSYYKKPKNEKINQNWSGSSSFDDYDFAHDYYLHDHSSPFDNVRKTQQDMSSLRSIDKDYNNYVLDVYSSMKDVKNREQLQSYDDGAEDMKEFFSQEEIDSILMQQMCPYCLSKIEVTNELLLNISCNSCYAFFNSTHQLENNVEENDKTNVKDIHDDLF